MRYLLSAILYLIERWYVRKKPRFKCDLCKEAMAEVKKELYLIPVQTDHTYEASADYFHKYAVRIDSLEEIPKGQRACWFTTYQCQVCGKRQIYIRDFLYTRETEVFCGDYLIDDIRKETGQ